MTEKIPEVALEEYIFFKLQGLTSYEFHFHYYFYAKGLCGIIVFGYSSPISTPSYIYLCSTNFS